MLILQPRSSLIEPLCLLVLHMLAGLALAMTAIPREYLPWLLLVVFVCLVLSLVNLCTGFISRVNKIVLDKDSALLIGHGVHRFCKLADARTCGELFTLLIFHLQQKPGNARAFFPNVYAIVLTPDSISLDAHRRLRRHLRFSAWTRDAAIQDLAG